MKVHRRISRPFRDSVATQDSTQNKELQSYLERILNPTLGGNGPVLSYSALPNEVNKVNSFLNMTFKMKPEK